MNFDAKRNAYKPQTVKILFVGESRPHNETFFYNENSNLYSFTKQAFEQAFEQVTDFKQDKFLDKFKELGCWLYDVCDSPVNHDKKPQRNAKIKEGIDALIDTINDLQPEFIIVVKRGYFGKIVRQAISNKGYIINQNASNLRFPACGNQKKYRDELAQELKRIFKLP